jgi:hypothetical protein
MYNSGQDRDIPKGLSILSPNEGLLSMVFPSFTAFFLFPAMILFFEVGRLLRKHRATEENGAVESAVFALFGLLLAFTFSGAVSRYDAHRQFLIQETNAISTAYDRVALAAPAAQPKLRQLFRDYASSRMKLFDSVGDEISPETIRLQGEIWDESVQASVASDAKADAGKLLLPAINDMVGITYVRRNAFNMHPPAIVYWLLYMFSCISAFLAGYGMKTGLHDWTYVLVFAFSVSLTIFTTLEIEYPRRGMFRPTELDQHLVDLRNSMQ